MKFQCQFFLSSNGIFLCAVGELLSLGLRDKTVFNTENNKLIITGIYFLVKKFPCVQRRCLSHSSHISRVPSFTVVANQSDPICSWTMPYYFLRPRWISHDIPAIKGVYWNMNVELSTISIKYRFPVTEKGLSLKVDYWQMVSVSFSDNCRQILQVWWEEGSVGGCQTSKLGLLKALKICSHVTGQWEVQSHQMQCWFSIVHIWYWSQCWNRLKSMAWYGWRRKAVSRDRN